MSMNNQPVTPTGSTRPASQGGLSLAKRAVARRWASRRSAIETTPIPDTVGDMLEDAARVYADRTAWSFFEEDDTWSFSEVRDGAHQAANALLELGIKKGDRVAVMVPNSALYLLIWLGLAILGAAVVPVNARYTAREVLHVLKTSEANLLILDPEHSETANAVEEQRMGAAMACGTMFSRGHSDTFQELMRRQLPECQPGWKVDPDDLLNVQFTSGTSGFPKGCMLTHRYWTTAAVSWNGTVDLPVERILVNQMLFYVDGQFASMFALNRGATLFCARRPSAKSWLGWVRKFGIQAGFYFAPMFKTAETPLDSVNELLLLTTFGFQSDWHAALESRFGTRVRESYGMTELAPVLVMPTDAGTMVGSGSCGLPAPFCEVKIVDSEGTEVGTGEAGELIVRSPAQMLGYYGDPESTARTIQGGWLHTGDLFRRDEEGFFYIVGRKKDMVRRNSENVACAEVEAVLRSFDAIAEAAVVGVPDDRVGEEIKAYIQLRSGLDADTFDFADLVTFCRSNLAVFKVPRYYAIVKELPMTESARVSKPALTAGEIPVLDSFDALKLSMSPKG